jgi:hypothetical protein
MQDSSSRFTDRLTPVVKAALVFGVIAGVAVGVLSGLVLNVAAGILIGVLVLIAVVAVASLAVEEKPGTGTLSTSPALDTTVVIEPVESDGTAPEQQQT